MLARLRIIFLLLLLCHYSLLAQKPDSSYAQKLGYPKNAKLLILHVDDVGMSFDSNEGAINAMEDGVANSCSVMMPCSWVPAFVHYLRQHPTLDAGLHLTLTSEWKGYRWGPLSGKELVPGLVDKEGAFWSSVEDVVKHASADEVDKEMRAQLARAKNMGFEPTHLDSHMGTLFASPEYLMRYVKLGMEQQIPVMLPGGHNQLIRATMKGSDALMNQMRGLGTMLWNAGLPVLDDLHNESYDWEIPKDLQADDKRMQAFKTAKYVAALKTLQPGITMMIMHCTETTALFPFISGSGPTRKGDLLAMIDPVFKKALSDEGIQLVTWRELMEKRKSITHSK